MRLPFDARPDLMVSKDEDRYALQFVAIQDGFAVAVDGKMMMCCIVSPEDTDADRPVYLRPETVKLAQKKAGRDLFLGQVLVGDDKVEVAQDFFARTEWRDPDGVEFPHWRNLLAGVTERNKTLNIDATRLAACAKAMGSEVVNLHWNPQDPTGAILVTCNEVDRFCIMMPCMDDIPPPNKALAKAKGGPIE